MNLLFVECRLVSPKCREVFVMLLSIECMSISFKFMGLLGFAKVRGVSCKIAISYMCVDFVKV